MVVGRLNFPFLKGPFWVRCLFLGGSLWFWWPPQKWIWTFEAQLVAHSTAKRREACRVFCHWLVGGSAGMCPYFFTWIWLRRLMCPPDRSAHRRKNGMIPQRLKWFIYFWRIEDYHPKGENRWRTTVRHIVSQLCEFRFKLTRSNEHIFASLTTATWVQSH